MAAEPRSLSVAKDIWLTDSRAYNLIWLGRWMERAWDIARAAQTAAYQAQRDGGEDALAETLAETANSLGLQLRNPSDAAAELILNNQTSSVLQCLLKARVNATQVAPVEFMRALSDVILDIETMPPDTLQTPDGVIDISTVAINKVTDAGQIIEDQWFGREALSDEETFRRFAQQQQQQQGR